MLINNEDTMCNPSHLPVIIIAEPFVLHSLANVALNGDDGEEQYRCRHTESYGPHWKLLVQAEWVDEPSSVLRVAWRNAWRHRQLLSVCVINEEVQQNHQHDGDGNSEVTECTTNLNNTIEITIAI